MDLIWEKFTEWLKELLVGGIMDNLTGLFDNVNAKVAEAAGHIGSTPQAWNANIYSMIRSLSDNVILPIAGVILAFVMTLELIQLIADRNNLHDIDTWVFFKWVFKTAAAVLIVSNTWNIVMGVFEAAQSVVNSALVCSPNNGQSKRLVQILCGKYPFKLNRSMVAQRLVNPAPVVKQHVFRNRIRRLFARPEILPVEPFHLQRLEERLGTGIIIRRARAAHTLYSADFLNFVPEIPRCILAAAIGVDYQFSLRPSVHYRVPKRSYRKPTVQHTAYCPANYSPAEQVYECAQIQPSFVSRHICEIRYPFLIRLVCLEILPQQILKWLCFRVGYGCTYILAPCYWHKSCHGHQSPHALPAYIFADFAQFHLDFPTSVDALAPEKDVFNLHGQVTISYFTRAVFSSLKLIVSLSACL